MSLSDASFWLETLWWGGIAVLGIFATLSQVRGSRWAERRRRRRFAARRDAVGLAAMSRIRDEDIAAQRAADSPPA